MLGLLCFASTQAAELVVTEAYAREMPPGVVNSAVYLTMENTSNRAVVLLNVTAVDAAQVMIHQNTIQGDMMRMRPVAQLKIAAHSQFSFSPGGYHLMLMGLSKPLQAGETFDLIFQFEAGQAVKIKVPVIGNNDGSDHHRLHKSMDMKVQD